jgi:C1A family cysteine protease
MQSKVTSLIIVTLLSAVLLYAGSYVKQDNQKDVRQDVFESWKIEHGISFSEREEKYRFSVFLENLNDIETHNAQATKNYEKGLNQFSHLTPEEFASTYLSSIGERSYLTQEEDTVENFGRSMQVLQDVDWQVLGKVSDVKNQGSCDAGYAFCSASLLESSLLVQDQKAVLSEQQIIDCSADYTTFGCGGGSRSGTLQFAKEKGLVLESTYGWKGVKGTCQKPTGTYKLNWTILESNGCDDIKNNLYKSPMTIAVNARTWQSYKSGVYDGCTSTEVNHDIYLIGVSLTAWRLKNSWGVRWGENGYIRLKLGNTCGICEKPGFGFKL